MTSTNQDSYVYAGLAGETAPDPSIVTKRSLNP